ncbi:MAG: ECF transporter S component [Limosilactobacillus sp.]|uniref:ECF transporter S component n=1 Tax=Limosilactobacillus sp. TaxID=2773925 RepID=UPI0026FAADE3|nr:ECF transporter S component [Limosilactobacillus sp.]
MTVSYQRTRRMVGIACFSALSFILMMFEFPVIPVVSYLKIDFSDLPILLGAFIYGPLAGVLVALIKCLLHWMMNGFSIGDLIGVTSSFLSSMSLLVPFTFVWKQRDWTFKHQMAVAIPLATLSMTVVMSALNLWVLTPLYMAVWHWQSSMPVAKLVAIGIVPFNIIKGLLVTSVFALVCVHLKKWLAQHKM